MKKFLLYSNAACLLLMFTCLGWYIYAVTQTANVPMLETHMFRHWMDRQFIAFCGMGTFAVLANVACVTLKLRY